MALLLDEFSVDFEFDDLAHETIGHRVRQSGVEILAIESAAGREAEHMLAAKLHEAAAFK